MLYQRFFVYLQYRKRKERKRIMKAYIVKIKTRFDREECVITYASDIKEAYESMMKEEDLYGIREIISIVKSTILNY